MTRLLLGGAATAAILVAGVAVAQTTAPVPAAPRSKAAQPQTRADVQARIARQFARLDANRDGFVTRTEAEALTAKRAARTDRRAERRARHLDPAAIFGRLDSNKDGRITRAEAEAARNAHVVAKEGQPAKAHAVAFGGLFNRADTNRDGAITRAEFDAAPKRLRGPRHAGAHRGFAGRMFETADANKDGRVSLAEAQQVALQHFDRADLNRDGTLTREERRQARQLMRAQRRSS